MKSDEHLSIEFKLSEAIKRLIIILSEENDHLEHLNISGLTAENLEEKVALIVFINQVKNEFAKDPNIKTRLNTNKLDEIREDYKKLHQLMLYHQSLINYGRAANKRVIQLITKKRSNIVTYNNKGEKKEKLLTTTLEASNRCQT